MFCLLFSVCFVHCTFQDFCAEEKVKSLQGSWIVKISKLYYHGLKLRSSDVNPFSAEQNIVRPVSVFLEGWRWSWSGFGCDRNSKLMRPQREWP